MAPRRSTLLVRAAATPGPTKADRPTSQRSKGEWSGSVTRRTPQLGTLTELRPPRGRTPTEKGVSFVRMPRIEEPMWEKMQWIRMSTRVKTIVWPATTPIGVIVYPATLNSENYSTCPSSWMGRARWCRLRLHSLSVIMTMPLTRHHRT